MDATELKYDTLIAKYPQFFPKHPDTNEPWFYIECNEGWYNILDCLFQSIAEQNLEDFQIIQIKEKFGGLRFLCNYSTPALNAVVDMAERLSYKTCEICGNPGKVYSKGWTVTRCSTHCPDYAK